MIESFGMSSLTLSSSSFHNSMPIEKAPATLTETASHIQGLFPILKPILKFKNDFINVSSFLRVLEQLKHFWTDLIKNVFS